MEGTSITRSAMTIQVTYWLLTLFTDF
jgi:hypothetical protein